jgi:putative Mn2+ efflux pump MntP
MLDLWAILLLAVGLAMDFVSVAVGLELGGGRILQASRLSMAFGFFHVAMPLLGWWLGLSIINTISEYDHWVAFLLLTLIGVAIILTEEVEPYLLGVINLLGLSIATSIDAIAVGVSLHLEGVPIIPSSLVIGSIVALLTFAAASAGGRVGRTLGRWTRIVGGIILISVGLRILMIHFVF